MCIIVLIKHATILKFQFFSIKIFIYNYFYAVFFHRYNIMNNDIKITDINGSRNIHLNVPILILNDIPLSYLIQHDNDIPVFNINIEKLYNSVKYNIQQFIPIGQIYISNNKLKTCFNILMINILFLILI